MDRITKWNTKPEEHNSNFFTSDPLRCTGADAWKKKTLPWDTSTYRKQFSIQPDEVEQMDLQRWREERGGGGGRGGRVRTLYFTSTLWYIMQLKDLVSLTIAFAWNCSSNNLLSGLLNVLSFGKLPSGRALFSRRIDTKPISCNYKCSCATNFRRFRSQRKVTKTSRYSKALSYICWSMAGTNLWKFVFTNQDTLVTYKNS